MISVHQAERDLDLPEDAEEVIFDQHRGLGGVRGQLHGHTAGLGVVDDNVDHLGEAEMPDGAHAGRQRFEPGCEIALPHGAFVGAARDFVAMAPSSLPERILHIGHEADLELLSFVTIDRGSESEIPIEIAFVAQPVLEMRTGKLIAGTVLSFLRKN